MNFFTEHGISSYEELDEKASAGASKKMKIEKLPSDKSMKAEHGTLAAEKYKPYAEYKTVRKEATEYSVTKQNVDSLLSVPKEPEREKNAKR